MPIIILIIIIIFPISADSQKWRFEVDSLRDDGPIIPMVINPLIDGILPIIDYSDNDNEIDLNKVYNGFMVQVLSTQNGEIAENMRMQLISQIIHKVRVIFEAPNYKVRVGVFTDRNDAERLRKQLYALGYRRAWIVRARLTLQDG
ncbi:MAG: SPOR domain-containing protein [Candidatus Marinimicrobia bacterium]|nr:SPOR domain-containing protein [Candidatus Neomarinimicrobiota bacterium]